MLHCTQPAFHRRFHLLRFLEASWLKGLPLYHLLAPEHPFRGPYLPYLPRDPDPQAPLRILGLSFLGRSPSLSAWLAKWLVDNLLVVPSES